MKLSYGFPSAMRNLLSRVFGRKAKPKAKPNRSTALSHVDVDPLTLKLAPNRGNFVNHIEINPRTLSLLRRA